MRKIINSLQHVRDHHFSIGCEENLHVDIFGNMRYKDEKYKIKNPEQFNGFLRLNYNLLSLIGGNE